MWGVLKRFKIAKVMKATSISIYGKINGDIRMRSPLVANTDYGWKNLRIISQFDTYWRTYVGIQI